MMKAAFPKVSIITPSYNQGWCIERTILSVLRQDYPNIEYIVMDALSTDETASVLKRYEGEIDIIVQEKDKGQADAINRGLKMASGDMLAYLNSDDCYASPSIVSQAVAELMSEDKPDVVYGRRYFIDQDGFFVRSWPYREFDAELLYLTCYLPQECCFWTRSIYEKGGGYVDESYRFAMDYELWLRLLKSGAKFKSIDAVFGLFRWHENQKSQELWKTVALPEIERLQMMHSTRSVKPFELQVLHEKYMHGVDLISEPRLYEKAIRLSKERNRVARESLADTPLDLWVFQHPDVRCASTNCG
jgi:glycosyltransferase involved in cell wall biosynthesis